MTAQQAYLAFDLGTACGRVMLSQMSADHLRISEIHRFSNSPVCLPDGYHWDVLGLWQNVKDGLRMAARQYKSDLVSLGVDSWGSDFALLDKSGSLLFNPYCYMDNRTEGMLEEAFRRVPRNVIFEQTGMLCMRFNTLYQLLALAVRQSPALREAHRLLMFADLYNYWFSGNAACEFTEATTSQCLDIRRQTWAESLLERMNIPLHIFPPIVQPGTLLGAMVKTVVDETGSGPLTVVAPACHNTASAVAAVPAETSDSAWITSDTWSIMGVEVKSPMITPQAMNTNLANEGGVCKTYRLTKNIAATWLIRECMRAWAQDGQTLTFNELTGQAVESGAFLAVIDPDAESFLTPGDMPVRIRSYCQKSGQSVPESKGAILRVIFESTALKYRWILEQLESVLGRSLNVIHVVGAGIQNQFLCQVIADATNRVVKTGPLEATAVGNILIQMIALGRLHSLGEGRELVRRSFPLTTYEPHHNSQWDAAYGRLLSLL